MMPIPTHVWVIIVVWTVLFCSGVALMWKYWFKPWAEDLNRRRMELEERKRRLREKGYNA